jgi:mono/diheme cytochrome c family protein
MEINHPVVAGQGKSHASSLECRFTFVAQGLVLMWLTRNPAVLVAATFALPVSNCRGLSVARGRLFGRGRLISRGRLTSLGLLLSCLLLSACGSQSVGGVDDSVGKDSAYSENDFEEVIPATQFEVQVLAGAYSAPDVARGKYLAELLACGTCHTDGALVGRPDKKHFFAGSGVGIAYSNPTTEKYPGVVYPANITPDRTTGIGRWTDAEVVRLMRTGVDNHGQQHMSVMPWPAYHKLTSADAYAITAFLRSLPAVRHQVPSNVKPGTKARAPFVHFGVYQSKRPR